MTKSEALRQLRKILVSLYSTEASVRLIAEDADLIIASITFDGTIENCWQEILKEADKHNKIREIIQLASEEYRVRESELERIWHEYDNAVKLRFVGEQSAATTKPTITTLPPAPASLPANKATEDADFLRSLLAQHQRNLQLLQRQKAIYVAGEEPLRLLNQIAAEEEEIAKLQQQLGA